MHGAPVINRRGVGEGVKARNESITVGLWRDVLIAGPEISIFKRVASSRAKYGMAAIWLSKNRRLALNDVYVGAW